MTKRWGTNIIYPNHTSKAKKHHLYVSAGHFKANLRLYLINYHTGKKKTKPNLYYSKYTSKALARDRF